MKYKLHYTKSFKQDLRILTKGPCFAVNKLSVILNILKNGLPIPEDYKDHPLKGNWQGFRELHIQPDWIIIYKEHEKELILALIRTSSHAKLFKK
ncbi:MAG: type II toxin-antitoxin system YafQ family toxin [Spirochaetia bacterium]|nr:type II toxin-antitoxin system YafQ family toxin [Spirochaetia bacterium]